MKSQMFITTVLWLVLNICTNAQSISDSLSDRVDALFAEFNNQESPGAAIVIVKDNEIIYKNEYGVANLEYGIPIKSNTVFHIGSVSKQFTALSILLLEDRGQLSLNDAVIKYIPDFPAFGDTIRIRHLIHHTSGLRETEALQQICGISNADLIEQEPLFRLIKRQKELNFKPGDEIEYCNTGYILLAKIVEIITGKSFTQWSTENIFTPLGMINSQFYKDCTKIVKNRAYPYWRPEQGGQLIKGLLNYSYVGSTSVFTTSNDIAKWLQNFSNPKIGNDLIMHKMLSETDTLNNGTVLDYGYGMGITTHKGLKVNLHSGHDAAYRAADLYFPEYKLGIAVLSNFYSINPTKYGFMIAEIFLEGNFPAQDLKSETESQDKKQKDIQIPEKKYRITKEKLSEYEGKYFSDELETQYTLQIENNKLVAKHWRNEDVVLNPEDKDLLSGNQWWFKNVKFIRDTTGEISGFRLTSGRVRNLLFRRVY